MHVLFFTYDVPFPPNSGGKTRALNLLKYSSESITYSLFSFTRPGFDLADVDQLKKMGISSIELFPRKSVKGIESVKALFSKKSSVFSSLYYDKSLAKTLKKFIEEKKVDLVHFESFYTGFYLSEDIRSMGVKQIYGSENIEYRLYEEMNKRFNPVFRPFLKREVEKIKQEEIDMVRKADGSLAVTTNEAEYFQKKTDKKIYVIENGVAMESFPKVSLKDKKPIRLLFIGNFSYFPNVDGLTHFYKDIFEKLDSSFFKLIVVGRGVGKLAFLDQRVEKIEYIPDVYDAYAMADIFVSPIRIGGGTNFKVLEAMAAGLPVVSYAEKTSDMGFVDGHDILQARTAKEFHEKIEELAQSFTKREMLGKNAREVVSKLYNWEVIGKKLNKVWNNI